MPDEPNDQKPEPVPESPPVPEEAPLSDPLPLAPFEPGPGSVFVVPEVVVEEADEEEEGPTEEERADAHKYQGVAMLGYLLFFVPLIFGPNSRFARYHANQGLILNILWLVYAALVILAHVVLAYVPAIVGPAYDTMFTFGTTCVVMPLQIVTFFGLATLIIYGIVHAINGVKEPLPLFGRFVLIHEALPGVTEPVPPVAEKPPESTPPPSA